MVGYFFCKVSLSCRSNCVPWSGSSIIIIRSINLNLVDFFYDLFIRWWELQNNEDFRHLWTRAEVLTVLLFLPLNLPFKNKMQRDNIDIYLPQQEPAHWASKGLLQKMGEIPVPGAGLLETTRTASGAQLPRW